MKSPITGKEMVLIKEKRTLSFRKEEFEVVYHSYKCEDSGESFTTTQLDELNLNQVYNQYRVKHNLPFPDEIMLIRKKYGLSAAKMSEILGFGANVYRNYETGEIPSQSNARLIQLAKDPKEFKQLIGLGFDAEGKSPEKIYQKIDAIIQKEGDNFLNTQIEHYLLGTTRPNAFTGYRIPNLEKFREMVVFFTERMQPWKTKLNKLMFYADFGMFSKVGLSISGAQYRAISLGPVPDNYQSIYEFLEKNGDIEIHYTQFSDGGTGEQFKPNPKRTFNPTFFSEQELNELEETAERFNKCLTGEIIDISHLEKVWIENQNGNGYIDFKYGFELR